MCVCFISVKKNRAKKGVELQASKGMRRISHSDFACCDTSRMVRRVCVMGKSRGEISLKNCKLMGVCDDVTERCLMLKLKTHILFAILIQLYRAGP